MPKVNRIFLGDKQVRPYRYNPGSSTLAYFPFENDTLDYSGNGVTLSISGSFTKGTNGYTFSSSTSGNYVRTTLANVGYYGMWYKINSVTTTGNSVVGVYEKYGRGGYFPGSDSSANRGKIRILKNSSYTIGASTDGMSTGVWHHFALAYDGTKFYLGKDGVLSEFYSGEFWDNGNTLVLANVGSGGNINVTISDFIAEIPCWSAADYLSYYNQTKSNYGL